MWLKPEANEFHEAMAAVPRGYLAWWRLRLHATRARWGRKSGKPEIAPKQRLSPTHEQRTHAHFNIEEISVTLDIANAAPSVRSAAHRAVRANRVGEAQQYICPWRG